MTNEFEDPHEESLPGAVSYSPATGSARSGASAAGAVLQRHEGALLAIPGVVGVGVQRDESGRDVIAVYVAHADARGQVPENLEGIPVRVHVSGEFFAQ